MSGLDKVLGWFGVQRRPRAAKRVYAGADFNRLTQDWFTSILSADQEIKGDMRRLRGAARSLVRDNPYGSRFVAMCEENVVGHHGVQLQMRLRTTRGTPAAALNQQVEDLWRDWACDPRYASADGRHSWSEIQRLILRAVPQDGYVLVRHVRGLPREQNPYGYSVQLLDADYLDHEFGSAAAEVLGNGNIVRLGCEMEPTYGRVVAYWLWTQHPSEYQARTRQRVRVPAEDLELLQITLRPGQTLGVSWFAPVLLVSKMAQGYEEAAITAARVGASSMAAIELDVDKMAGPPQVTPGESTVPQEFEPGRFWRLNPGEKLSALPLDYPSGEFGPFIQNIYRSMATGLGVAYASLTGDLTAVNYSSIRAGLITERDFWRGLQSWLITHLHRRVFAEWIKSAALYGQVPARDVAGYLSAATWKPRGWRWVDPQSEVEANARAVTEGFATRSDICADLGVDFEDVVSRLAEEHEIAKAAGVTLGAAAATTPPPVNPAETDDTETDETEDEEEDRGAIRELEALRLEVARESVKLREGLTVLRGDMQSRVGDVLEDVHAMAARQQPQSVIVTPPPAEATAALTAAMEKMVERALTPPAPSPINVQVSARPALKARGLKIRRDASNEWTAELVPDEPVLTTGEP